MEVLKKFKTELPYDTATKHGLKLYMNSNVHCSTVYNSQDMESNLNVYQQRNNKRYTFS